MCTYICVCVRLLFPSFLYSNTEIGFGIIPNKKNVCLLFQFSFSDMHVPIGELIRMVRLYSTPWEDKSTALKKLHDDYEGKKTQLNIAIKRLEFIDAQVISQK